MLTAAILRVDVDAIGRGSVDVRTADTDNPYDPTAAACPGHDPRDRRAQRLRPALALETARLYAPTTTAGFTPRPTAAAAAATPRPARTPPALTNVPEVQDDYLFRIDAGGYYGSPNPVRGEHVLAGGNPTDGVDPEEVVSYPVGTAPDADFDAGDVAFNFGQRVSPNGAIEYRDDASTGSPFDGQLDGRIIQTRYSRHGDLLVMRVGGGWQRERGRRRV